MDSKLEAPTKELMELIFSDIMFQQAMQVHALPPAYECIFSWHLRPAPASTLLRTL